MSKIKWPIRPTSSFLGPLVWTKRYASVSSSPHASRVTVVLHHSTWLPHHPSSSAPFPAWSSPSSLALFLDRISRPPRPSLLQPLLFLLSLQETERRGFLPHNAAPSLPQPHHLRPPQAPPPPPFDAPLRRAATGARNRARSPSIKHTFANSLFRPPSSGDKFFAVRPPPPSSSRPAHLCNPPTVKLRRPPVGGAASSSSAPTRRTQRPLPRALGRLQSPARTKICRGDRRSPHAPGVEHLPCVHARFASAAATSPPGPHLSSTAASSSLAFASSRIGSRSGAVRYDKFSGCPSASFNRYEDMFDEDDISKVTLPAWPGQGYGRHWLSSGLLVQFVSCPYSDVFDLLYDLDLCLVYLYLDSLESLL
nr:formin-like protein 14 [Lolium perenne]